ncbi:MAG: hypothetical protein SPK09_02815, partial [Porphyromonas sp.]|nr:hypothetical protein [Porphyromonas sp.]
EKNPAYKLFREAYQRDLRALAYYIDKLHRLSQALTEGRITELANEYAVNASVIQAVVKLRKDNELYRKVRGKRGVSWADMATAIAFYKEEVGHTLGTSPTRFAQWVRKYDAEGYDALISKKFGNMNTLKLNVEVERLLIAMAKDKHRPYRKTVWEWYCDFRKGGLEYYDLETGELFDRAQFPDLSEKTVADFLNGPVASAVLSKTHDSRHDYMTRKRPHHRRIKPRYSLSMLTFDDKDFTAKVLAPGLKKPTSLKAYFAFDVASGAVVGWSFGVKKDKELFLECVRSMYRNLLAWGLGQPYEAQVENHLVSSYSETMMKSGHLFPEVTFAGAENSQEKYAERLFHSFKHQIEKYNISGVGRHYAKNEANRVSNQKVNDADNSNFVQEVYDYDEAVSLYTDMIRQFNEQVHPDSKLYAGKTRLEVLKACVNPEIQPINMRSLARWAGRSVETSITRGQFTANYEEYSASVELLDKLRHGSNKVTAYWWEQAPLEMVDEMYLYQGDVFLGICDRIIPYQVSKLERTGDDMRKMAVQRRRITEFDEAVNKHSIFKVGKIETERIRSVEIQPVKMVAMPREEELELEDVSIVASRAKSYASRAIEDL